MKPLSIKLLIALVLSLMPVSDLTAQEATPGPAGTQVEVPVEALPPDRVMMVGLTRTTLAEGESIRADTASGPTVLLIEAGSVILESSEDGGPVQVSQGATPTTGKEIEVHAGASVVLPKESSTTISNASSDPAVILTMMTAPDAAITGDLTTAPAILVSRDLTLPEPPLILKA